jgi:hypothetical protein
MPVIDFMLKPNKLEALAMLCLFEERRLHGRFPKDFAHLRHVCNIGVERCQVLGSQPAQLPKNQLTAHNDI